MDLVESFKTAFRLHPAGISIISATTDEGPVGLTASSVASVGLDPVSIVFSVTRATGSAGGILGADTFVVHLIDSVHQHLAETFAITGSDRFTSDQGWQYLETGEPFLPAARVALRCRAIQTTSVGPSMVVIAEVLAILTRSESIDEAAPLVYHDRTFHNITAAVPSA